MLLLALLAIAADPARDTLPYAGLPPERAAAAMTVPEGFQVQLVAGEPDVMQPIAFCFDDRGRLWVAEAYAYPKRQPEGQGKDRIVIFEDATGAGRFTKRTVFTEGLNLVSGLAYGYGGLWVGAAPQLLFIPVNRDADTPAGPAEVVLDGWGYQDTHETLNTFVWGPDGWLYGCHGVFTHSKVGKPGCPPSERVPLNAGVWRLQPRTRRFEVFAHGTSNPWGLDFDRHGEAFVEACVIPHCFHLVPGGRYFRQAGAHFNPFTYADIATIADHRHYLGDKPHSGNERSDAAGGGHAHAGLMIYQGDAWPAEYRDKIYMGNLHGHRINVDVLKPNGSSFTASHGADFLKANDAWYRGINFQSGPDGNVYLIDWYDAQACHNVKSETWDRSNGRIYKIVYRGTAKAARDAIPSGDVSKLDNLALANLLSHTNVWHRRHALRLLHERHEVAREPVRQQLTQRFGTADADGRLAASQGLHALGLHPLEALTDAAPSVRAWAVRFAEKLDPASARDSSPVVRRAVASRLQRATVDERRQMLPALLSRADDAGDPALPLLAWYALEPLSDADPDAFLSLAREAAYSPILTFAARKLASTGDGHLERVAAAIADTSDAAKLEQLAAGLAAGLRGRPSVTAPPSWPKASARLKASPSAERGRALDVVFGSPAALAALRATAADHRAAPAERTAAFAALSARRDAGFAPTLLAALADSPVRHAALTSLAPYDDIAIPDEVLKRYATFTLPERRAAIALLAGRPAFARQLLTALESKAVPSGDVPAESVRQLRSLRDATVMAACERVWGVVLDTPAERQKEIAAWKTKLSVNGPVDMARGAALFVKNCGQCHTLFGTGGKVGPDLTGSNRADLDYLLENVVTPSAVVPREYVATAFNLTNGRQIIGIVREETAAAVTLLTATETVTIPKGEIDERQVSPRSMMPEDILKALSEAEVRDLIGYLRQAGR